MKIFLDFQESSLIGTKYFQSHTVTYCFKMIMHFINVSLIFQETSKILHQQRQMVSQRRLKQLINKQL